MKASRAKSPSREVHRIAFNSLAQRLNITQYKEWYNVDLHTIERVSPSNSSSVSSLSNIIQTYYEGSLAKALQAVYPQFHWQASKFQNPDLPQALSSKELVFSWPNFSSSINIQRHFLNEFARNCYLFQRQDFFKLSTRWGTYPQLGSQDPSTKYFVGWRELVCRHYDGSVLSVLESVYPEYEWQVWKYQRPEPEYWSVEDNCVHYFSYLHDALDIANSQQWKELVANPIHYLERNWSRPKNDQYYHLFTLLSYLHQPLVQLQEEGRVYPKMNWFPWLIFEKLPSSFWANLSNQREFFGWLSTALSIEKKDDWYPVNPGQDPLQGIFSSSSVSGFTTMHRQSIPKMLANIYPEYNWEPWLFQHVAVEDWCDDISVRKQYFDWVAKQLNLKTLDDWHGVKKSELFKLPSFAKLLAFCYDRFLTWALDQLYPYHDWKPWLIERVPLKYWSNVSNQKKYFDWLAANHLKIDPSNPEQWNQIKDFSELEVVRRTGGTVILEEFYENSLRKALEAIYPDQQWHPSLLERVPVGFWHDFFNQRKYFDWLAKELHFTKPSDWYTIPVNDISRNRFGGGVLHHHDDSLAKALDLLYPEYEWYPWLFLASPRGFWNDEKGVTNYVHWLFDRLSLKHPTDWYHVSYHEILWNGGEKPLRQYGLLGMLQIAYPGYPWDAKKFDTNRNSHGKAQRALSNIISKLFPNVGIELNYLHPKLIFSKSGRAMELDIYLRDYNLAFEYQGEQHYHSHGIFAALEDYRHNDQEKRDACQSQGITLIEIPYWWQYNEDNLIATIHKHRPDLIASPGKGTPFNSIAPNDPKSLRRGTKSQRGIVE